MVSGITIAPFAFGEFVIFTELPLTANCTPAGTPPAAGVCVDGGGVVVCVDVDGGVACVEAGGVCAAGVCTCGAAGSAVTVSVWRLRPPPLLRCVSSPA